MSNVKLLTKEAMRYRFRYCTDHSMYYQGHINVRGAFHTIGTRRKSGHVYVKIDGEVFNVRDVVWVYHHGPVPPSGLRYKDGIAGNNRIDNIIPVIPREWVSFL